MPKKSKRVWECGTYCFFAPQFSRARFLFWRRCVLPTTDAVKNSESATTFFRSTDDKHGISFEFHYFHIEYGLKYTPILAVFVQ